VNVPPERRFADALVKARGEWAAADAAAGAARAGCRLTVDGVLVPLFGRPHLVTHPGGDVVVVQAGRGQAEQTAPAEAVGSARPGPAADLGAPAHIAVAILLLHYLLLADGAAPAGSWSAYRELPDGLFYAASFADRAEAPLTRAFAGSPADLDAFRAAARAAGGDALTLGDASFRFVALPRVDVAVLVWAGDDEEPGEARMLFDANAGHYLPAEDLAGLGGQLAHQLAAAARA
jgi:hypothetical protein